MNSETSLDTTYDVKCVFAIPFLVTKLQHMIRLSTI